MKLDDDEDLKNMLAGLDDEALEMDFVAEPAPALSSSVTRNPFKREGLEKLFTFCNHLIHPVDEVFQLKITPMTASLTTVL